MDVSKLPQVWHENYAHPCAWDMVFEPLSLVDLFGHSARHFAARPLID
ncbi:MAG: hypothetical protein RIQ46_627, partial [Pseudomonadota bacterium]